MSTIDEFDGAAALAEALARRIAGQLAEAIAERGSATLAVSGGNTPKPLFEALSRQSIDWGAVLVTQVDERWVPEDHLDSNARLIRSQLLQGAAAGARFISMKTAAAEAFDAEAQASQALAAFRDGIDVTVLGMGSDGHTASFFPGASTLSRALDPKGEALCVAVRPPVAPHDRMTLSLAGLLRSRHLYLHISGAEKRQVLDQALAGGPVEALPIRAVLFQSQPELHVYYEPGS